MPSREQHVEDLRFRLVQLLAPFGWRIKVGKIYPSVFGPLYSPAWGVSFEALIHVKCPDSLSDGQVFAWQLQIFDDMLASDEGRRRIDAFAREVVLDAMDHFAKARMPQAPETDWRPDAVLPEDYYAR